MGPREGRILWCQGKCCRDMTKPAGWQAMQEEQVGLWKYIQPFGLVTSPSCNLLLTQLRFPKDHLCRYVLT